MDVMENDIDKGAMWLIPYLQEIAIPAREDRNPSQYHIEQSFGTGEGL